MVQLLQNHSRTTIENKVTFIDNVTRTYLTHEIPENGTGEALAESLVKVARWSNSLDYITSISSDGCPVNTGAYNGANR